ncbi:MAG: hypothetical protein QNJ31_03390 [Candidatus Caenarcaniphilales bacterium]|nr:hypothetical protein [Candidatus Caenarcaniphilales bacterium]
MQTGKISRGFYTLPTINVRKYEQTRDKVLHASKINPKSEVPGAMALAFARAAAGKNIEKTKEQKAWESDSIPSIETSWNSLDGVDGNSILLPNEHKRINGNSPKKDESSIKDWDSYGNPFVLYEILGRELEEFEANDPERKLTELKDEIQSTPQQEVEKTLSQWQEAQPIIVELYKLEQDGNQESFQQLLERERNRLKQNLSPELQNAFVNSAGGVLINNPDNIWGSIVQALFNRGLVTGSQFFNIDKKSLRSIDEGMIASYSSLAKETRRTFPIGHYERIPQRADTKEDIYRTLADELSNAKDTSKIIFSPTEIIAIAKPYYDQIEANSRTISGKSLAEYESELEKNQQQIDKLTQELQHSSNSQPLQETEDEKQSLINSLERKNQKLREEIESRFKGPHAIWSEDGTKFLEGAKGVDFKDYDGKITDDTANILGREIQKLYNSFSCDDPEIDNRSFVKNIDAYLHENDLTPLESSLIKEAYIRSLDYYGRMLNTGGEAKIGGHSQIVFSSLEILSYAPDTFSAKELLSALKGVLSTSEIDNPQMAVANLSIEEREQLRLRYKYKTGEDLVEFDPKRAIYGDSNEYFIRQPHYRQTHRVVREERTQDGFRFFVELNKNVIKAIRSQFVNKNQRRETPPTQKESERNSPVFIHYYENVSRTLKSLFDWIENRKQEPATEINQIQGLPDYYPDSVIRCLNIALGDNTEGDFLFPLDQRSRHIALTAKAESAEFMVNSCRAMIRESMNDSGLTDTEKLNRRLAMFRALSLAASNQITYSSLSGETRFWKIQPSNWQPMGYQSLTDFVARHSLDELRALGFNVDIDFLKRVYQKELSLFSNHLLETERQHGSYQPSSENGIKLTTEESLWNIFQKKYPNDYPTLHRLFTDDKHFVSLLKMMEKDWSVDVQIVENIKTLPYEQGLFNQVQNSILYKSFENALKISQHLLDILPIDNDLRPKLIKTFIGDIAPKVNTGYRQQIELVNEYLAFDPNCADILALAFTLEYAEKHFDQAEDYANRFFAVSKEGPLKNGIYVHYAKIKIINNKYPEALSIVNSVLKSDPDNAEALLLKAIIFHQKNSFQEAKSIYIKAERAQPGIIKAEEQKMIGALISRYGTKSLIPSSLMQSIKDMASCIKIAKSRSQKNRKKGGFGNN